MNDSPGKPKQPHPKPEPNGCPAVVSVHELYTLEEVARRLRWKRHSIRQALRNGLVTAKFGSRRYCTGRAVRDFMERLAQQQAENSDP